MTHRQLTMLVVLAAVWGGSFLFIRVAVPSFGPVTLTAVRVVIAAAALAAFGVAVRQRLRPQRPWRFYLGLGAVNAALPFVLIALAEKRIDASLAAIVNAATPLFSALVAAVWVGERLTRDKVAGLVLGIAGVAVVVGLAPQHVDLAFLASCAASLGGALAYGVGANWVRRSFSRDAPLGLAFAQQTGAAVILVPLCIPFGPPDPSPPAKAVMSVLALALLGTAAAYLIYFRLIAEIGPTNTLTVTLLVPVFGVIWGAAFLSEPVTAATVIGGAMVVGSVVLVTGWRPTPGSARRAPR